jgi:hypothetical protein
MSIRLLQNPRTPHELFDDLESVYWTMLYGAFHRFRHSQRIEMDMFSETSFEEDDNVAGGDRKLLSLLMMGSLLTFECEPLNTLFASLSMALYDYYSAFFKLNAIKKRAALNRGHKNPGLAREAQAAVDFHYQKLNKPSFWREELKDVLSMEDWIDNDFVKEDWYKKQTQEEALQKFKLASRTLHAENKHKGVREKHQRTNGLEARHDSSVSSRKEYGGEELPAGNDGFDGINGISSISRTQQDIGSLQPLPTSPSEPKLALIPSHSELPVSKTNPSDPESQPVKAKRSFVEDDNVVAGPFNTEHGIQRKRLNFLT